MTSPLRLIAIVGMPGAGKSMAAHFFRSKNLPVLRFGDQTEIGLGELGKEITEENERWYREKLRKDFGMKAMAIKIEPRIIEAGKAHPVIVLDGLYSWEEYTYLKEKFPQLTLLCIFATPAIRYQRLEHRNVRPLTRVEAASRDISEIEHLNKGGPIAAADYFIKNESTQQEFVTELEKFYSPFA